MVIVVGGVLVLMGCNAGGPAGNSISRAAKASDPSPADRSKGVSPDTKLSWAGEQGVSYDVCFGKERPPALVGRQSGTSFDPGPLDWDRTYYWRIDIVGGAEGDIWAFTTFWYGDPNAEEMDI